ncbi:MAG: glycosyltransferase family 2 protein [Candidatus Dormibacteraeota bacterium]|uniref:Glycosyltransferase family 2 protein n=1 Tax=Candidatus Amunia macphersoniae TaxID=3127014 RepID=A0A934KRD1_9BACT|nr:glycosyltransferase family 2 protein [Candidatus Dormibacteraeota bacterium]
MSIIVLVTDDSSMLRRCLVSIDEHRPRVPVSEVIVVANGTPPKELDWLFARTDIVLLISPVNLGFGGGCNWAAAIARGRRLLFMNDDAVATPLWLSELNSAFEGARAVGVAGSRVLLRNGTLQEAGGVVWRDGSTSGVGRGMNPAASMYTVTRDVDYVSFCSAMVAREAWDAVGGLDDDYFPAYYEDTDFCLRARSLGWGVICAPGSVVVHAEGSSTSPRFKRFLTSRNRARFVAKWQSTLAGHVPPPSLTAGQKAVERALGRTALRARSGVEKAGHRGRALSTVIRSGEAERVDAADIRSLETRTLRRLLAVDEAYIDALTRELEAVGPATVIRQQYRSVRAATGRMITRHPRVGRLMRTVIVSVGNRD